MSLMKSIKSKAKELYGNFQADTGIVKDTAGATSITALVVGLIFIAYLVPMGLRELANANMTGVDATQQGLFGLIGLMVVLGLVKRYSGDAQD